MAEYDLKMMEDQETSRMQDSLALLQETLKTNMFVRKTQLYLIFTKRDMFAKKIMLRDLSIAFPCDVLPSCMYF